MLGFYAVFPSPKGMEWSLHRMYDLTRTAFTRYWSEEQAASDATRRGERKHAERQEAERRRQLECEARVKAEREEQMRSHARQRAPQERQDQRRLAEFAMVEFYSGVAVEPLLRLDYCRHRVETNDKVVRDQVQISGCPLDPRCWAQIAAQDPTRVLPWTCLTAVDDDDDEPIVCDVFTHVHPDLMLSDQNTMVTATTSVDTSGRSTHREMLAVCGPSAMNDGQHFAEFTIMREVQGDRSTRGSVCVGLAPSDCELEGRELGRDGTYGFDGTDGDLIHDGYHKWDGQCPLWSQNQTRVGFLLDCEKGCAQPVCDF
jgi:hypothetical protein